MDFNPNPSLTRQVSDYLEQKILVWELKPNDRIQEVKFAKELKVSRNSLREALIMLERRHLINILPRRGAVVRVPDEKDVKDLFDLIGPLYCLLAEKAALRWRDQDLQGFAAAVKEMETAIKEEDKGGFLQSAMAFPMAAFPLANNSYLENIILDLQPACARLLFRLVDFDKKEMAGFLELLKRVTKLIETRKPRSLRRVILGYTRRLRWQIAAVMKTSPSLSAK